MVSCAHTLVSDVIAITCLQVLRSIGYHAPPVKGVPYDTTMRAIPNTGGRVAEGMEEG
jgi:hypothetical protein